MEKIDKEKKDKNKEKRKDKDDKGVVIKDKKSKENDNDKKKKKKEKKSIMDKIKDKLCCCFNKKKEKDFKWVSAEDREMNEQFARWTKKPIESANADDILLKLKNKKALIIQCFARIYLAKIIVYNAWKDAEFNMNSFHDQYILDRKNSHMAKNARLAARNKFIKQYVTDIIHTCTDYYLQRDASTLLQRFWRGYRIRCLYPIKSKPRKKIRKIIMRYKRDTYRRVWARKYWQPKDGNQLKSGYLEYDMNEHVHKPPAGNDHGLLTYKVIANPRSEKELHILTNDPHAWVAFPTYVQTEQEYFAEKYNSEKSELALSLRNSSYSKPLNSPVSVLDKVIRATGDAALYEYGWNGPETYRDLKQRKAYIPTHAYPDEIPVEFFQSMNITNHNTINNTNNQMTSSISFLPSSTIYENDARDQFNTLDKERKNEIMMYNAKVALGLAPRLSDNELNVNRSSYLEAITSEISELNRQRFGPFPNKTKQLSLITPLRGSKKFLNSGQYVAMNNSIIAKYPNKYNNTNLSVGGTNLLFSESSSIFSKNNDNGNFQNKIRISEGYSIDIIKGQKRTANNDILPSVWSETPWGKLKQKAALLHDQIRQRREQVNEEYEDVWSRRLLKRRIPVISKVRIWPIRPKKHYKLRYTWMPQPLIKEAAMKLYIDQPLIEEDLEELDNTDTIDVMKSAASKEDSFFTSNEIKSTTKISKQLYGPRYSLGNNGYRPSYLSSLTRDEGDGVQLGFDDRSDDEDQKDNIMNENSSFMTQYHENEPLNGSPTRKQWQSGGWGAGSGYVSNDISFLSTIDSFNSELNQNTPEKIDKQKQNPKNNPRTTKFQVNEKLLKKDFSYYYKNEISKFVQIEEPSLSPLPSLIPPPLHYESKFTPVKDIFLNYNNSILSGSSSSIVAKRIGSSSPKKYDRSPNKKIESSSSINKNTSAANNINLKQIRNELNNSNLNRKYNKNSNNLNSPDKMITQVIKVKAKIKPIQHPYTFL